jgi:hypothetical protein
MVTGYHAGVTNMAAAFGARTLLLWDDRFPNSTSMAVVPPAQRGTTYKVLQTKNLQAHDYAEALLEHLK